MKHRRTLLIIQPGFYGLAIQRGRTADLFTCPQAAAALGVSVRWMHRYVRSRRKEILYQLGRPLLWRSEVIHLRWALARRRRVPQRIVHTLVTRRRP